MVNHINSEIKIKAIGVVQSEVAEPVDENWGGVVSRIVLEPEYLGGLEGMGDFSHALVICYLHQAQYKASRHLKRRPRGERRFPEVGIFSQRVKDRPNPIGVTAVEIVAVGDDYVEVRGLDAIDGTPVLDIKPYFPQFDRVDHPRIPPWADELMAGYF